MSVEELFNLGAVAVVEPQLLTEGVALVPVWAPEVDLADEYAIVSAKAIRAERVHKPDAHLMRMHYHGGWAIVPYECIGQAVGALLAPLLGVTGSKYPTIKVEPMIRDEVVAMRGAFERGSGER